MGEKSRLVTQFHLPLPLGYRWNWQFFEIAMRHSGSDDHSSNRRVAVAYAIYAARLYICIHTAAEGQRSRDRAAERGQPGDFSAGRKQPSVPQELSRGSDLSRSSLGFLPLRFFRDSSAVRDLVFAARFASLVLVYRRAFIILSIVLSTLSVFPVSYAISSKTFLYLFASRETDGFLFILVSHIKSCLLRRFTWFDSFKWQDITHDPVHRSKSRFFFWFTRVVKWLY